MPDLARTFCAQSRSISIRDQCELNRGWWARLARAMRLAPTTSLDSSRSNARGRSDLHSPSDAWTSQTHDSPGIRQDRRGTNAASSRFRQNGVSRLAATGRSGFASRSTGLAGHVRDYASSLEIQMTMRVFRGRVTGRPRLRQESEGGISRRVGRQPGGQRTALISGHGTVGPSSWHVRRLTPRPWKRRMLQRG